MDMETFQAAKAHMIEFAKERILEANTVLAMIDQNPNIQPPYPPSMDPESWNVVKINAQRILDACGKNQLIDMAWIHAIHAECGDGGSE